jgi:hypothetical protein
MLAEPHGLRIAIDGQVANRERLHRAFLSRRREVGRQGKIWRQGKIYCPIGAMRRASIERRRARASSATSGRGSRSATPLSPPPSLKRGRTKKAWAPMAAESSIINRRCRRRG